MHELLPSHPHCGGEQCGATGAGKQVEAMYTKCIPPTSHRFSGSFPMGAFNKCCLIVIGLLEEGQAASKGPELLVKWWWTVSSPLSSCDKPASDCCGHVYGACYENKARYMLPLVPLAICPHAKGIATSIRVACSSLWRRHLYDDPMHYVMLLRVQRMLEE